LKDPTDIWIEEADEITHEDFIKADTSVRTTKSKHVRIWLTFNPEDDECWIKKVFVDRHLEGSRDDVLLIHTTYKDNLENLQQSYIDTLEALKVDEPDWYDVFVLGLWGAKRVLNPFASQYQKGKHEAKVKFNPAHAVHFSIDFNYDPFGLVAFQMWTDAEGEHCHIIDEFAIKGGTIKKMADEIRGTYGQYLHMSTFTGDYGGTHKQIGYTDNRSLFEQLKDELRLSKGQFKLISNPRHKTSRSDCNYFLLNFADFKINPVACMGLCRDMKIVQVDATGSIIKRNRKDESQLADHLDCFRYIINTHYKQWIQRHQKRSGYKAA
ncbi:hypothetical protein DRO66_09915, partial [Candidatus Bathyarchaeota archaeon]